MRILVTGATGFIGRALVPALQHQRHTVLVWARSGTRARSRLGADIEIVTASDGLPALTKAIDGCDAIINLAGESIMGGRWTDARRDVLRRSRIGTTELIVRALAEAQPRPRVFVSGSAVGYYGNRGATPLTEASPAGTGFLADLCQAWEAAAREAARFDARVVIPRIGVVLGRDGGALAPMSIPVRLGIGGPLGSGRQFMPWIHLHDLVRVILTAVEQSTFEGPVNCVAPEAATNRELTRALGRALRRPAIVPVPAIALRVLLGEAAGALLDSQHVIPAILRAHDFQFAFPTLDAALADIFSRPQVSIARLGRPVDAHGSSLGQAYLARRRPVYELRTATRVAAPLEETFRFFSRAANLGLLTPAAMNFSIHGDAPDISEGAAIEYRLRVGPIPVAWRSRIIDWMPGERFIDIQEQGPYRAWWHEHTFRADGTSTVMEDRVCYAPPVGPIGRLANMLFIAPSLRRIFQYRADVIRLRFGAE